MFGAGYVTGVTAMEIAAWVLLLVQLNQGTRSEHFLNQTLVLGCGAVAPVHLLGTGELGGLVYPLFKGGRHRHVLQR